MAPLSKSRLWDFHTGFADFSCCRSDRSEDFGLGRPDDNVFCGVADQSSPRLLTHGKLLGIRNYSESTFRPT